MLKSVFAVAGPPDDGETEDCLAVASEKESVDEESVNAVFFLGAVDVEEGAVTSSWDVVCWDSRIFPCFHFDPDFSPSHSCLNPYSCSCSYSLTCSYFSLPQFSSSRSFYDLQQQAS